MKNMQNKEIVLFNDLKKILNTLICNLLSIYEFSKEFSENQSLQILTFVEKIKKENKTLIATVNKYKSNKNEINDNTVDLNYSIKFFNSRSLNYKIDKEINKVNFANNNLIVYFVSNFDYFLSCLYKTVIKYYDYKCLSNDLTITFNEAKNFKNKDQILNYFLDIYIDKLFRKSHEEIIDELENRFAIREIRNFKYYKYFLFICGIRNLIVHNDSIINSTFIRDMNKINFDYSKHIKISTLNRIVVNSRLINLVFNSIIYTATYITLKTCTKISSNQSLINDLAENINSELLFHLFNNHKILSLDLYECLLNLKLDSSYKFAYTLNRCMLYKNLKEKDKMHEELNKLDWSNSDEQFIFGKNCLLENTKECLEFLNAQKDKRLWDYNLQTWPICSNLIKNKTFLRNYKMSNGSKFIFKVKNWENRDCELKITKNKIIKKFIKKGS